MEEEKTIEENTKRTTRKEENEKNRKRTKKIIIIIGICIIVLLCMSTVFAVLNMTNEKVINGVYISDINVSNLTKKELEQKLQEITEEMSARKIVLKYQELETAINLNDIDLQYNLDEITNQAYNIGRDSNIFVNNFAIIKSTLLKTKLNMDIKYNEELIDKKIEEMGAILPGAVEEYAYYIEGEELVITKGKPGLSIEKEKLKKQIREAIYKIGKNEEIINVPVKQKEPDKIDMEKIHDEIYKEPVDAYITQNPTTVHPNVNGVNFAISVEEATKLLEEDKEEYRVPLKITVASKTISDLGEEAFPDILGTFTTRYDATNKNRSNNISLAAQKINGTVILPGETFSYNKTVGKRTKAAGFKEAGAYAGGKVIQEVGGGICQVSSTLYNVEDTWQMPPPTSWITLPPAYAPASLNPAAFVLFPTVLLYEKVSPGNITVPFIFCAASDILLLLFLLVASYLVVKVPSISGKASSPRSLIVLLATVIFNGTLYSSLSSSNNFVASSTDIAKFTPFTFGCTVVGFCVIYASTGSLYISSCIFSISILSGSFCFTGTFIISSFFPILYIASLICFFNFSFSIESPGFPFVITSSSPSM